MKPAQHRSESDDAPAPSGFQPTDFIASGRAGMDELEPLPDHDLPLPAGVRRTAARPTLTHIGRYALKQRLAVGGLGAVYEAWDPMLSRTVAVKTLQFDIDTPARVSLDGLLLHEARTAAGLDHRGIVTVHDAGLSAHGVYITMERLVGRDLRDALAQGWRPSPRRAALLARRVAEALAYAHSRGVVHCDIKPANIFLSARLRPKVLDFGIARAVGAGTPALAGLIAGSPHYLAPEQLRGGEVTERTDVYALGVVLYELLTARKAFEGESLEAIIQAVLAGAVPSASEIRPEVPTALASIVAHAMARDPAERCASAAAMAHALRGWLGEKVTAAAVPVAVAGHGDEDSAPMHVPATVSAGPSAPAAPAEGRGGQAVTAARPGVAAALVGMEAATPALPAPRPARRLAPRWVAAALGLMALLLAGMIATRGDPPAASTGPHPDTNGTDASNGSPASSTAAIAAPAVPSIDSSGNGQRSADVTALTTSATKPATRPAQPRMAARPVASGVATPATPAAPAQGAVRFAITPWGHVDVDGAPIGITPPLTTLMLPVGEHHVMIRNDGAPTYTATILVDAERPVIVRHRFVP